MKKFLDYDGLVYLINKIKSKIFVGSTNSSYGKAGLVPAPPPTPSNEKYVLTSNGSWEKIEVDDSSEISIGYGSVPNVGPEELKKIKIHINQSSSNNTNINVVPYINDQVSEDAIEIMLPLSDRPDEYDRDNELLPGKNLLSKEDTFSQYKIMDIISKNFLNYVAYADVATQIEKISEIEKFIENNSVKKKKKIILNKKINPSEWLQNIDTEIYSYDIIVDETLSEIVNTISIYNCIYHVFFSNESILNFFDHGIFVTCNYNVITIHSKKKPNDILVIEKIYIEEE